MGRILTPGHKLVAGSSEDFVAMFLAIDASTPLSTEVAGFVTPVCPPAKAYIVREADIPDLEGQELELRKDKPHLFPRRKDAW